MNTTVQIVQNSHPSGLIEMAAKQPHYSPKQVGESLQVSESSIKRWCDSGQIPTVKTVGGHRRITLDGLQQFLRETNRSLLYPEVLGLPSLLPERRVTIRGSEDPQRCEFRQALATGDEKTCASVLRQQLASGWTRGEAAEHLIADAMHGIGDSWQVHELDVYQERRSCEICLRLIHQLRAELPPPDPQAPTAIGGTPSGDPYQLPTAIVELALREIGWNAVNLGSNLPLESFRQAAVDYLPRLVWMSVSVIEDGPTFVAAQNKMAASLGEDVPLLLGGRGLDDKIRPRLRFTAYCDSIRQLVELASMIRLDQ